MPSKSTPKVYLFCAGIIDVEWRRLKHQDNHVSLTDKEFDLLHFFVSRSWKAAGRKFTPLEVSENVWPDDKPVAAKTIGTHISNIRRKLSVEFVLTTRDGYVLLGAVEDATPPEPEFLAFHRVVVAVTIATTITVLFTMLPRAILAQLRMTLTQAPDVGFVLGWFQGVIGPLVWGIAISASLLHQWFVTDRYVPAKPPWWRSLWIGGVAGGLAGFINSLALLGAQRPETLSHAAWIPTAKSPLWMAFTDTRMAFSMPIFGVVIGASCAFTTLWIVHQPKWASFLSSHAKLTNLTITRQVFCHISKAAVKSASISILIPMLCTAFPFSLVLGIKPDWKRIFGECLCISIGGIGLVVGLLFALYSLTKGVEITADDKCSLSFFERAEVSPTQKATRA